MDAIGQQEKDLLFLELKQFISEIIGPDIVEELDITKDSTFAKDMEMDSIEIVAFAEKVKAKFGNEIDFAGWLSAMNLDQLVNLSLNDIINYIVDVNSKNK